MIEMFDLRALSGKFLATVAMGRTFGKFLAIIQ
jgi:hypothetical protein